MGKIRRAWKAGLSEGLEGSSFFIGVALPIIVLLVVVIGAGVLFVDCKKPDGPKVCTDYSFKSGLLDDNAMTCTRWPAMKMSVEKRLIKADIVHCRCTPESFAKPTTK